MTLKPEADSAQTNSNTCYSFEQASSVKILITNKVKLVDWLSEDLHILDHVYSDGIITTRVHRRLKNTAQPEDAISELIDRVTGNGEGTSSQFLKLLRKPEILREYPQLKEWISSLALPGKK